MKVLLTGSAGFIASFVARRLLERGDEVVGLDNINGCCIKNDKPIKKDLVNVLRELSI